MNMVVLIAMLVIMIIIFVSVHSLLFCRYCMLRRVRTKSQKIVRRRMHCQARLLASCLIKVMTFCRYTTARQPTVNHAIKLCGT